MKNKKTALYRHFDADNNLLYVGISLSAVNRLSQHKNKKWFYDIVRIDVEWFDDRDLASNAELKAIRTERPKFNVTGNHPGVIGPILEKKPKCVMNKEKSKPKSIDELPIDAQQLALMIIDKISYDHKYDDEVKIKTKEFSELFGFSIENTFDEMSVRTDYLKKDKIIIEKTDSLGYPIIKIRKYGWFDVYGCERLSDERHDIAFVFTLTHKTLDYLKSVKNSDYVTELRKNIVNKNLQHDIAA
jgi:hypothetical protein